MIIVGITGPIGHGKTTFGNALGEQSQAVCHFESSTVISEVANDMHAQLQTAPNAHDIEALNHWIEFLPAILEKAAHVQTVFEDLKVTEQALHDEPAMFQKLWLHLENLQRQPELFKQEITPQNKNTYRPFLQWLGGYLPQKVDSGLWYKEIVRRMRQAQDDGCEFCIVGGLRYPVDADVLRSVGAKIIEIYRPDLAEEDATDPTERERDAIQPDSTVISNGGIDDLEQTAKRVYQDLLSNQLKPEYQTAPTT